MKKYLLFTLAFVGTASAIFFSMNKSRDYYSYNAYPNAKQGHAINGMEFIYKMKANHITGILDVKDVMAAKQQINNMRLNKAGFPLVWTESGPDNVGGRCRTILIDKDDPNVLYAAGVSGGIFKSTNAAASWKALDDAMSTLAFQSSCQDKDGNIYFGSGENAGGFGGSPDREGSAFPGEGIFKSTDGQTFTQLATTKGFNYVNCMAYSPKDNVIYAGTESNLKYSDDGGATWKNVFTGLCRDVKVTKEGTVLAYMGAKIYRSTTGTVANSYTAATGITGGFNRMVLAISPQDPNYVYVLTSASNNFGGLFQSTDGGISFNEIVPGGSTFFNPLNQGAGGQGNYDLCVAVHPRDKKKVFMGGVIMAEWTETKGPIEVNNGTHSDHHWFIFDTISSPMRMYNGNDGGVYRSVNEKFNYFAPYNIGFNVTQFYGIAANSNGDIIGGTQDNGTQYISKVGTEKMRAEAIYGGDGFRCEISKKDKNAFVVESYYGNIARSQNKGASTGSILDKRVPRFKLNSSGGLEADPKGNYIQAPFNTAIKLVEVQDTINRLFVGANSDVWMVEHVINPSKNPTWFKVATVNQTHVIEASDDGKHIFIGRSGALTRVTIPTDTAGHHFYFDTLDNLNPANIYPGIKEDNIYGNLPAGRFITGIAIDRLDANKVLVTMGNYGSTNFIYYSEDALAPAPTWREVQGNLPRMPVFDAEFVYDKPGMVVIGTEFGIWGTTNINATTVSWQEQNQGVSASKPFPRVAVFELRQVESHPGDDGSIIVAGTHGRGIFETSTLYAPSSIRNTSGKETVKMVVYPNPVQDFANLRFSIKQKDNIRVKVMDLSGKVVYSEQLTNQNTGSKLIKVPVNDLINGTYVVSITGNYHKGASKIIVQH
ncbi:MAG: T9SS type A sorting domain-containing protein [Flavobacteriales bacterium]|nr:T9SS type A sorting domain-containing protein [Flavobacteriales bacterium]